ncbi:MAG: hypothetical protein AVDCRST_MAG08-1005, partial [uncultured Acetobacteraceae bacterium]
EFACVRIEASRSGCRRRALGRAGRRGRTCRTGARCRAGLRRAGSARHRRNLRLRRARDRSRHAADHRLGVDSPPACPPGQSAGGGHDRVSAARRGPNPFRRQARPVGAAAQAVWHRPTPDRARQRGSRARQPPARL